MKFNDLFVSREEMFSMGIEEVSGQHYVSFPVSNGMVDYEEYYAIDQATFELFQNDLQAALEFVARARKRELDQLLIIQPGKNRGTAI
ncbi:MULTISPECIES: hypothetical protein [Pseudomonas]|uniref:hypothetical protein n=1 Tax=Pseudomonas TaxID=286 RepID=UPI000C9C39A3|nr:MULTISPECIES: hypothetical protein [Pseudomonas]AXK54639.1 hypothetical protein DWF74_15150 [Pseudomonas protegens]MCL9655629.1 hypothetical protein [Pseudomonas protegens]MDP4570808.1 hypothetical protein [Pseudomonas sp. LPH60]PNG34340.1 hypothetical protein A1348_11285 [Pseudomonas protegens]BCT36295.1 hypothetical protein PproGo58_57900 [Pseudomonas protegens]